ncbi:glycosyltransferase, partial [Methanobrevibacter sp.]|uniref:glycosyltransferase n=1 Tax=Methanobrevibacter sp. TaxID=66852 RepID=UPI002E7A1756
SSSANMGIQRAKGEYVILVDNDDIIPLDAYEKLYNRAKEVDADISIGKAHLLGRYQQEMNFLDNTPWTKERIITDVNDYPEIFYDVFYWNNIIKRDLLIDNNVVIPEEIKIYGERCFTHKAYTYAKKISIIPDCVYLWRKRSNALSRSHRDLDNFNDRMNAYFYDLDHFTECCPVYFNTLFRRALIPIKGILYDKEFEDLFFERILELFEKGSEKIDNFYDNQFTELDNIRTYLILNGYRDELKKLLKTNFGRETEIFYENGKCYWKLPLFRNPNFNIPDELFEIRYLKKIFISIDEIASHDDHITFTNLKLPKYFEFDSAGIYLKGLATENDVLSECTSYFELEKIENEENSFNAKLPLDELNNLELYTVSLRVTNKDGATYSVRITGNIVKELKNNNRDIHIFNNEKNNLFITCQRLDNALDLELSEDELIVSSDKIKKDIKLTLKENSNNEKFLMSFDEAKTQYKLNWKFFLDKNTSYEFFMTVYDDAGKLKKRIKVKDTYMKISTASITTGNGVKVEVYVTPQGNIMMKSN